jgi:hypothetical protein
MRLPTRQSAFALRKPLALLVALVLALSTAAPAFAASDPTASQYNTDPQQAAKSARSPNPGTGLDKRVGSLPVTGTDLIVLGVVALTLLGTGVALKRLQRPRSD